jgi:CDP-diacylglycerol--serine O-phosphatidyltransferase
MVPRFVGRLGVADYVTVANAALGFAAAAAVLVDPGMAARLILLAAVADGLDGVIARRTGGTAVGPYLDALADVASFCVAPALFAFAVALEWAATPTTTAVAAAVPALFVGSGIVRLGLYTAHDPEGPVTVGVPTTLAATLLAAAYLAGVREPRVLLAATGAFAYLMLTRVRYPDLYARDALAMGGVQALAVLVPGALAGLFPRALLGAALAYLLVAPRFYWRRVGTGSETGERAAGSDSDDARDDARPPRGAPERKRS